MHNKCHKRPGRRIEEGELRKEAIFQIMNTRFSRQEGCAIMTNDLKRAFISYYLLVWASPIDTKSQKMGVV